ncbi:MAG: prolipoprotein diacylglyceryl transferase [Planctomycetota bacterium]
MRSTLFYIPHADPVFGIPLFGTGWLLALLIVFGVLMLVVRARRQGWNREVLSDIPLFLVLGAAIVWVGPLVEEHTVAGVPIGVPIRGYGVMVLLGIVTSVLLLLRESRRMGIHPDYMLSLAFLMVLIGFVGARIFYVIEYWHRFAAPTWGQTFLNVIKLTDGGLVVYGSFIGACLAFLWSVRKYKLPVLATADLLASPMMLGLALGRVGCFLNGCCWGAVCGTSVLGVTFPAGSPPFIDQIENGTLLDMRFEEHSDKTYTIKRVERGGLGDRAGLEKGDRIERIVLPDQTAFNRMRRGEATPEARLSLMLADGQPVSWEFSQLPKRAAPVYPTQIFSSINAALICLFLWAYYPFRQRDGEIAALLVSIYPVTRFLLEVIRADEPSLFAMELKLTISQSISLVLFLGVIGLWIFVLSRPKGSALPLVVQRSPP